MPAAPLLLVLPVALMVRHPAEPAPLLLVTEVRPGGVGPAVLGRADQAMYRTRGAGGNPVTALAG